MYRKGMPFTQEDVQRARNVNLVEYLESCGVELKRKGRMVCLKEHDSLVIDPVNSKWHWNSHDLHGTNAVDFLMAYDNRTFLDAVAELLGKPPPNGILPTAGVETPKPKVFALPPRSPNMHRLYAYLTQTRGIDAAVVNYFVREKTLYEDDHHNCVFVGRNGQGRPVYAFQRGTLIAITYKGECENSDKRYSFRYTGTAGRLYVFEAAIDLLSCLTLTQDWDGSFLSLGGINDMALQTFLRLHPQITDLVFCLDDDVPGMVGAERMRRKYQKQYRIQIRRPGAGCKDWNERLVSERRNVRTPKKASFFKGGSDTLLVFRKLEDVRRYLECTEKLNDSLLLTGEHPEEELAAFQEKLLREKHRPITNINIMPAIAG